jgi:hypothetical protein
MTARASTVLDLLPSSRPRNPELTEQLMGDMPSEEASAPISETITAPKRKKVSASSASTTLPKVPVDEEIRPRRIRISMHVTKDKHYLVRKGAAELNMSVDTFLAAAVDAALRGLSLLE